MSAVPQPMRALEQANSIRTARACLKQEIADMSRCDGYKRAAEIVTRPPGYAVTMNAFDVLTAIRRVGDTAARKALTVAGVGERRQLGLLTDRERFVLAGVLLGKSMVRYPAKSRGQADAA